MLARPYYHFDHTDRCLWDLSSSLARSNLEIIIVLTFHYSHKSNKLHHHFAQPLLLPFPLTKLTHVSSRLQIPFWSDIDWHYFLPNWFEYDFVDLKRGELCWILGGIRTIIASTYSMNLIDNLFNFLSSFDISFWMIGTYFDTSPLDWRVSYSESCGTLHYSL